MGEVAWETPQALQGDGAYDLKAEEWAYLAEGRLHVILRYVGNAPRFYHHVLRLVKVKTTMTVQHWMIKH